MPVGKIKKNKSIKKTVNGARPMMMKKRKFPTISGKHHSSAQEMRFKISLIVLMALLSISAYMLAFVLAWNGPQAAMSSSTGINTYVLQKPIMKKVATAGGVLNDQNLDYTLNIPKDFGSWMYKIGYVKDFLDDSLANKYLKVYLPLNIKSSSPNFTDNFQDILTIISFRKKTWDQMAKGCQNGKSDYCNLAGTKLGENDDVVFAYTKGSDCPQEIQKQCSDIGKITDSFHLK